MNDEPANDGPTNGGPAATGPYAPPAPRRELTVVSADGSRLHAEEHGREDGPTVVLAHGWTCSTLFWAPVIRLLAGEHRVIVYDQRGHGRSPAAGPGGHTTEALADDLCAVLAAAGARAVVAGHSMGGMTVMAAAGRPELRERAAAALLLNTGSSGLLAESTVVPLRAGRLRLRVQKAVLGSSLPLGPVTPLGMRVLRYATMGPGATKEQIAACARIVHACPRRVRASWAREVLAVLDLDANLAALDLPTAVLAGEKDRLTPPAHARRLAAALPDCTGLTVLPGLGHMTPIEAPRAVADAVAALVRDHLTGGTPSVSAEPSARPARPAEKESS
ncbi:alpha/beta hydrolase [Streptomyces carminius]|uniref:Alpha/beta hydrolase n=1 Tax=Streptomyces carminius TaxID=2665496 RepID=A0A2M8LYL8_9ACTN|nr:alpha/beta hydrolase [Streptomyces carminius]PJE97035.1 alpha/beta hydrolase [Streptomyces carminius]PJE97744.1 alpha/beta hydrolase [Streptomyces carminius]